MGRGAEGVGCSLLSPIRSSSIIIIIRILSFAYGAFKSAQSQSTQRSCNGGSSLGSRFPKSQFYY